jgi:hypothetical protein
MRSDILGLLHGDRFCNTAPAQVWATLLDEGVYVFSRKTVGWMVATRESATLAEKLLAATITAENVPAGRLTIHAHRGSSIASKPVALLLADLGVTKTHFASLQDSRTFCAEFFHASTITTATPASDFSPLRRPHRPSQRRAGTTRSRPGRGTHPPRQPIPIDDSGSLVTFDWGMDLETVIRDASELATTTMRIESYEYGILGEFLEVFVSRKGLKPGSTPDAPLSRALAKLG